jgi:Sec-independent protein secretion pathway component TatC
MPEIVVVESWTALLFATLIFYVFASIFLGICILFLLPGMYRNAPIKPLLVIAIILSTIGAALALFYVCPLVYGFAINNFWIALLISAITTLVTCRFTASNG